MKTLLVDAGYMFNPEDMSIQKVMHKRTGIDRMYLVEEDCTVKLGDASKEAKAGDLVVTFYEGDFQEKFVVVTCPEWTNNIKEYDRIQQEEKERWALKCANKSNVKMYTPCDADDCETCAA